MKPENERHIIHKLSDGWYFWTDGYKSKTGPFKTREECRKAFDLYCHDLPAV